MKILYLNVYEGCPEEERFKKLANYAKIENPDILLLAELNGWDQNNFAKMNLFMEKAAFRYYCFCKAESGYHLGIFSKKNFYKSSVISEGMMHGMLRAEYILNNDKLTIIFTHLDPRNEENRLKEIALLEKYLLMNPYTILIGDMNSLSINDTYDDKNLLLEMNDVLKHRFINKFGKDRIEKKVTQKIHDLGFVDLINNFSKEFEFTVPTPFNKDDAHATKLRLDYAFASPKLKDKILNAKVIRDSKTDQLSDHYPLVLNVKF